MTINSLNQNNKTNKAFTPSLLTASTASAKITETKKQLISPAARPIHGPTMLMQAPAQLSLSKLSDIRPYPSNNRAHNYSNLSEEDRTKFSALTKIYSLISALDPRPITPKDQRYFIPFVDDEIDYIKEMISMVVLDKANRAIDTLQDINALSPEIDHSLALLNKKIQEMRYDPSAKNTEKFHVIDTLLVAMEQIQLEVEKGFLSTTGLTEKKISTLKSFLNHQHPNKGELNQSINALGQCRRMLSYQIMTQTRMPYAFQRKNSQSCFFYASLETAQSFFDAVSFEDINSSNMTLADKQELLTLRNHLHLELLREDTQPEVCLLKSERDKMIALVEMLILKSAHVSHVDKK